MNGWRKHYPPTVFPTFWLELEKHISHDRVWSCQAVYEELAKQRDELFEWAKARRMMFRRPNATTIGKIQQIMAAFPNFAAIGGSMNAADPWIIADAMANGCTVVTYEEPAKQAPKPTKPPKIPDVCQSLSVSWTTPAEFFWRIGITV